MSDDSSERSTRRTILAFHTVAFGAFAVFFTTVTISLWTSDWSTTVRGLYWTATEKDAILVGVALAVTCSVATVVSLRELYVDVR